MSPIHHVFRLPVHALALLVAVSAAAVAQTSMLGELYDPVLEFPALSPAAVASMHAAAAKLFEGQPIGAVGTWASTDGTVSGQVKLLHSFNAYNMPCRTIDYRIHVQADLNPDRYVLNWCRIPAGVWKIVQIPTPN